MKYIFWEQYNCQQISGLPKLIIMGIKAISIYDNAALISTNTSLVYRTLVEEKVKFEFIDEASLNYTDKVSSADVLVLAALNSRTFILHKFNPKVIIWQIYPSLVIQSWLKLQIVKIQFNKIIESHAFVSMSRICYDTFYNETGLYPNKIIPMPIDHMDYRYEMNKLDFPKHTLNVSYLGRAQNWKIYAVIRMLKDMNDLKEYKFYVHIFTDSMRDFEKMIKEYIGNNTQVVYYEGYYGKKLLDKISTMDLHYAMGISTLEGASMGVPTLLAPEAYDYIPNEYKYKWIYEDIEHYAGDSLVEGMSNNELGSSLFYKINQISEYAEAYEVSKKCYESVSSFSLSNVGRAITEIDTKLTLHDCHYRMISFWRNKLKSIF